MSAVYIFSLIFGSAVILIDLMGLLGSQEDSADSGDASDLDADGQAVVLPDGNKGRWVYRALNVLRSVVYFCCGFGAVGIYGQLSSGSPLKTFAYSSVTGLLLVLIVKGISRIQKQVTDSQLSSGDLLFAEAEVLVSIHPGKLGRVRVTAGGSYHDLFARGGDPRKKYEKGDKVFVVEASGGEVVVDENKKES